MKVSASRESKITQNLNDAFVYLRTRIPDSIVIVFSQNKNEQHRCMQMPFLQRSRDDCSGMEEKVQQQVDISAYFHTMLAISNFSLFHHSSTRMERFNTTRSLSPTNFSRFVCESPQRPTMVPKMKPPTSL